MKALTLIRPWAWAIAAGYKPVENRSWRPPADAIGQPLAIHAGRKFDNGARLAIQKLCGVLPPPGGGPEGVVAVVRLMRPCGPAAPGLCLCGSRWHESGAWGWQLAEIVALPRPVPCLGALGLWTLPAGVEAEVREQLEELAADGAL